MYGFQSKVSRFSPISADLRFFLVNFDTSAADISAEICRIFLDNFNRLNEINAGRRNKRVINWIMFVSISRIETSLSVVYF